MTNKEASEIIKTARAEVEWEYPMEYAAAFDKALEALEIETQQESILDKIKAEIKEKFEECDICEWFVDYDHDGNDTSEYMCAGTIDEIIDIIDKYKAESDGV